MKVDKTKNDILLTCKLVGYQDASANLESGYGAGTFGNIILGGGIGWAIHSATGADNKYPKQRCRAVHPRLAVTSLAAPPPPAMTPPTVAPGN